MVVKIKQYLKMNLFCHHYVPQPITQFWWYATFFHLPYYSIFFWLWRLWTPSFQFYFILLLTTVDQDVHSQHVLQGQASFYVFLKSRWLMLLAIMMVALIRCQVKTMEKLLLGSVSTNTFSKLLKFHKISEKHHVLLTSVCLFVSLSLSPHLHFYIAENNSTKCRLVTWD